MTTGVEAEVLAVIAAQSGLRVEPPIVLPARLIVELSGEAVRSRLCTFVDGAGREFCLRPDMTTPIADMVARGALKPGRFHSCGPVHRLPSMADEPLEFRQAGFEWFGGSGAQEDAEAIALALEAASRGGLRRARVRIGDIRLYHGLLDELELSDELRARLKRAFARRRDPLELLAEADAAATRPRSALAASLAQLSREDARRAVEDILAISGALLVGGRTAEDIAERLSRGAAAQPTSAGGVAALREFLTLEVPVGGAVDGLSAFARRASVSIEAAIARLADMLARLSALNPPLLDAAVVSTSVGRRFEYYDGVVFDCATPSRPNRPAMTGGRYDQLVARLGGADVTAIGAALRLDRLGGGA